MEISLAGGLKLQLYLFKNDVGKYKERSYLDYSQSVTDRHIGKLCTFINILRNPIFFGSFALSKSMKLKIIGFQGHTWNHKAFIHSNIDLVHLNLHFRITWKYTYEKTLGKNIKITVATILR